MNEMKQLYVLEWFGPYKSVEDLWEDGRTSDCSIYLITGREKYERTIGYIKYVGITERDVAIRLKDKDHLEKQSKLLNKKYWSARFSRTPKTKFRNHVELIETLFVRFLFLQNVHIINCKKLKQTPKCPVTVLNRWNTKSQESHRLHKPSVLNVLPDVLMFDGSDYWGAGKLNRYISE